MIARWGSRLRVVVVVACFLGLGWWINDATAGLTARLDEPHVRAGVVGEPVETRFGTVQVTEVQGAPYIVTTTSVGLVSPGIWLVAHFTLEPAREPTSVYWAELRDAEDRAYPLLGRGQRFCPVSNPGIAVACWVAIEMPVEGAVGASLVLTDYADADEVVRIDLGLDAATVERWAQESEPLIMTPTLPSEWGTS